MSNEANQKEKIQLYRTAAFSARRIYEQAVLDKQEETMAEVQEIIEKVKELATDSVKIATFAEQLVKDNPRLASSLEFMLGVELQEKARREEDASKV